MAWHDRLRRRRSSTPGRSTSTPASGPSGSLYTYVDASYGESVDYANVRRGDEFSVGPSVEFKLGRGLSTELGHTYERFTEDGEELYSANVSFVKAVYQFNRRMFVRGILQYSDYDFNTELYVDPDDVEAEITRMSSQVLLSYKINPQTVFFLGYSDSHCGQPGHRPDTERTNGLREDRVRLGAVARPHMRGDDGQKALGAQAPTKLSGTGRRNGARVAEASSDRPSVAGKTGSSGPGARRRS